MTLPLTAGYSDKVNQAIESLRSHREVDLGDALGEAMGGKICQAQTDSLLMAMAMHIAYLRGVTLSDGRVDEETLAIGAAMSDLYRWLPFPWRLTFADENNIGLHAGGDFNACTGYAYGARLSEKLKEMGASYVRWNKR